MLDADSRLLFFRGEYGNRSDAGCALSGFLGKTEYTGCGRGQLGMAVPHGGHDATVGGQVV